MGVDEVFSSFLLHLKNQPSNLTLKISGHFHFELFPNRIRNFSLSLCWEAQEKVNNISFLNFKDRGFVPATESEKYFQKRLKEILKQNDFSV